MDKRLPGLRTDIQVHARILNLMIHYELNNGDTMPYLVNSARRFFKKVPHPKLYMDILLPFFRKISDTPAYERKRKFTELAETLVDDTDLLSDNQTTDYIDYKSWINSKSMPVPATI